MHDDYQDGLLDSRPRNKRDKAKRPRRRKFSLRDHRDGRRG